MDNQKKRYKDIEVENPWKEMPRGSRRERKPQITQIEMTYQADKSRRIKYTVFQEDLLHIPPEFGQNITRHTIDDDVQTDEEQLKLAQKFCVRELNDAVEARESKSYLSSMSTTKDTLLDTDSFYYRTSVSKSK